MIAFFDLDRTFLRGDSGMSWMKFLHARRELSKLGLAKAVYWSALYKFAVLDMDSLATRLTAQLAGQSESEMIAKCKTWYDLELRHLVSPHAIRAAQRHREKGDMIAFLTGSTSYAAEAVAAPLGIEHVLCSRLEVVQGKFTGRLTHKGYGHFKVELARDFARSHNVALRDTTFYTDSFNDLPMLRVVGRPIAVNPDPRLRKLARLRGWPIHHWLSSG